MSEQNTITIPADLWGVFTHPTPTLLRGYADAIMAAERRARLTPPHAALNLLRHLADEIERQAPREVGWYLRSRGLTERVHWWGGTQWLTGPYGEAAANEFGRCDDSDIKVTPVTIGASS